MRAFGRLGHVVVPFSGDGFRHSNGLPKGAKSKENPVQFVEDEDGTLTSGIWNTQWMAGRGIQ
jgi:hypothetical protein